MLGDPIAWLEAHGAQRDVLDGLRKHAPDWRTLWQTCPRGDWLLGIATKLDVAHTALVRAAIGCARTALDRYEGNEACEVLVSAAAFAAEATIVATMECGLGMAMGWAHSACADAVRAAIPWELIEARADAFSL